MGLCKCPKRKVTNLFCFEHRVNVCESCLIANHETCVVQTYLSWLTDSDYDPNCLLCSEPLVSKETVRLKCLHIFHWNCLNGRASSLPNNTAPAGYKCPSCLDVIFPAENQSSPVVDKLRQKLQTVNWARIGLGLPSMPEFESSAAIAQSLLNNQQSTPKVTYLPNQGVSLSHIPNNHQVIGKRDSVTISVEDNNSYEENTFTSRSKAPLLPPEINQRSMTRREDEDESKYLKRASERNLRNRIARLPRSVKRIVAVLLFLVLVYFILSMMVSKDEDSKMTGEENPLFDPHANPHIKVERKEN